MAQVFVVATKAFGRRKPGDRTWLGLPMLKSDRTIEPIDPESAEAKAEVESVMSNVPGIALAPMNGTMPDRFDIRNPFTVERGMLLVERRDSSPERNVRWDFRERLMDIWEGRKGFKMLERKQVLRDFLKYHWERGGSREAFVDYVDAVPDEQWHREKIPGEIILSQRDFTAPVIERPLADELRAWVAELRAYPATVANRFHEEQMRDHVPGLKVCPYPWNIAIGSSNTYGMEGYEHGVWSTECLQRIDRLDEAEREGITATVRKQVAKAPDTGLRARFAVWTYASIEPQGPPPNTLDMRNPRVYLLDGTLVPGPDNYGLERDFLKRLQRIWKDAPLNRKEERMVEFLEHHFAHGPDRNALVKEIERIMMAGSTSPSSKVRTAYFVDAQQKALAAWVVMARKRLGSPAEVNGKSLVDDPAPKPRTLAERLDAVPGARDAFDRMLKVEGFTNDGGDYVWTKRSGKATILAIWDAVADHFNLEGFGMNDAGLSEALREYLPGLTIQKRIRKLEDSHLYKDQLGSGRRALKQNR